MSVGSGEGQPISDTRKGWMLKWTNYIKGYQKRWFILENGTLAYFRTQAEVEQACRGSIRLKGAFIYAQGPNIALCGGYHTWHLRGLNDVERGKWLASLELARVRAIKKAESEDEEELNYIGSEALDKDHPNPDPQKTADEIASFNTKLEELKMCQDLIVKHGTKLNAAIADLEQKGTLASEGARDLKDNALLFKVTSEAMIRASEEFLSKVESQAQRWTRSLSHEREQRQQLQLQMEQLALQHSQLERTFIKKGKEEHTGQVSTGGPAFESDDEFEDAAESLSITRESLEDSISLNQEQEEKKKEQRELSYRLSKSKISISGPAPSSISAVSAPTVRPAAATARKRRTRIPDKPDVRISLWSVVKNSIGKDLTKIPIPLNFNEPLSMLQRITEDLEYSSLLDKAAVIADSCEQMAYVAAFTVSSYSTTDTRTGKPFNPLLGETYECDRRDDLGWRSIAEQVSHHPPAAAQYAEGVCGWKMWQEFTMSSKFRGKYMSVVPLGISHLIFDGNGHHYTWRKVTTTVHNIIVGTLWIDNHGEMTIQNQTTGDKCLLKYVPYSYFSRDVSRRVQGFVMDKNDRVKWVLQGTWDRSMQIAKVIGQTNNKSQAQDPEFQTTTPITVWQRNPVLCGSDKFYSFTQLAVELNEPEPGVAPTDCRLRPDQRLMESGDIDAANLEKVRLEDKQRQKRKRNEAQAEEAITKGLPFKQYEPRWFKKEKDEFSELVIHMYSGGYWESKEKQDWNGCPDIF